MEGAGVNVDERACLVMCVWRVRGASIGNGSVTAYRRYRVSVRLTNQPQT
jgi:hypothetical protein